jgi:hypothetical protein
VKGASYSLVPALPSVMAQPSRGLLVVTPQAEPCSRWTGTGWVIREHSALCFDCMTRISWLAKVTVQDLVGSEAWKRTTDRRKRGCLRRSCFNEVSCAEKEKWWFVLPFFYFLNASTYSCFHRQITPGQIRPRLLLNQRGIVC